MVTPKTYRHGDETWLRVGDVVDTGGRTFKVAGLTLVQPEPDPSDELGDNLGHYVADVVEWNGTDWVPCETKLDAQHGSIIR